MKDVNADIIGMAEVDAVNGNYPDAAVSLLQMMQRLGYESVQYSKCNGNSANAVFYKRDKFDVLRSRYEAFWPGESQFYMHVLFCLKYDSSFKFIFGETHLKAKPANMERRSQ